MEAESYKKTFKFDVRYKIKKFSKIYRFGVRFGSQNGAKLVTKRFQNH